MLPFLVIAVDSLLSRLSCFASSALCASWTLSYPPDLPNSCCSLKDGQTAFHAFLFVGLIFFANLADDLPRSIDLVGAMLSHTLT